MGKLYDILKAAKIDFTKDNYTTLTAKHMPFATKSTAEIYDIPPIEFNSNGQPLIAWQIYGNTINQDSVGKLNVNLAIINSKSDTITNGYYKDVRLTNELPAGKYTISFTIDERNGTAYTGSIGRGTTSAYQGDITDYSVFEIPRTITKTLTLTKSNCIWARFLRASAPSTFGYSVSEIRVERGSQYNGYTIPVICNGEIIDIDIGSAPLRKSGDIADDVRSNGVLTRRIDEYGEPLLTPITEEIIAPSISTNDGSNTLSINTDVQPSQMYIKYYK